MGAYFDNNATTPLDPRVRDAMVATLDAGGVNGGMAHANPSSGHGPGRMAARLVAQARGHVAELLGGAPEEIVFTASGSEANTQVIAGIAQSCGHQGHLVVSALEHVSVRAACEEAGARGMDVTEVDPGPDGLISVASVAAALRDDTRLVCLMQANNELGTIQPVAEVATLCRERDVPVLCDAVQAIGKIPVRVHELGIDFLVLGGHKFHGPPGCAALWVRGGRDLAPLVVGAPQEDGRRAGTENVPGIVGLGEAARVAHVDLAERHAHLLSLRERFEADLAASACPDALVHCTDSPRLPHTSHIAFPGASGQALMMRLDGAGYAVSTGSACNSGAPEPSRVLLKMGLAPEEALASLRISFGLTNTIEEVDAFLGELAALPRLAAE